jgi:hypothetical protein
MTTVDLLGLALLGIAASLGFAVLAGGLLAFGEARVEPRGVPRDRGEGADAPRRRIRWRSRAHGARIYPGRPHG